MPANLFDKCFGVDCVAAFGGVPDKIYLRHYSNIGKLKALREIIK